MCFGATREPVEPLKKLEPSSKKTFCRYDDRDIDK
jgi:hypothetical protein